jgi:hypothetical protein
MPPLRATYLQLVREVQQKKKVTGACHALEYGIGGPADTKLALACYLGQKDWVRAAVMALDRRELEQARRLLKKVGPDARTCDREVRRLVAAERRKPSKKRYTFCSIVKRKPGSRWDWQYCDAVEGELVDWRVEQLLETQVRGLGDQRSAREALWTLWKRFRVFREADSMQVYYQYIDGSARNDLARGCEKELTTTFRSHLREVVVARKLPEAMPAAGQKKMEAWLAKEEARALKDKTSMDPENDRAWHGLLKKAQAAWRDYQEAWVTVGKALLQGRGSSSDVERRVRAMVTVARRIYYSPKKGYEYVPTSSP